MTPELSFDEYWPYWPEGVQGDPLVDMWYQCDFSNFVDTLWSPDSAFLVTLSFSCTAVHNIEELFRMTLIRSGISLIFSALIGSPPKRNFPIYRVDSTGPTNETRPDRS